SQILYQAFLNAAFLIRFTTTVTMAPITPPPAKFPSAAPISNPPPAAAPPSAGIKLCRIEPPTPPPMAPEIVLASGLRSIFFKKPPTAFPNRSGHDLKDKVDNRA